MKISKFIFNLFAVNTYVISDETKQAIIIDPGCYSDEEKNALVEFINKNQLTPVAIVNTHCHIDHVVGVNYLKNYYKIDFWASRKDQYLLNSVSDIGEIYGIEIHEDIAIDKDLSAEDEISFGNSKLKILEVPGHTIGHLAFFSAEDKFVLTGDVLFKDSIGRTDLPGGDLDILMKSIHSQILTLDNDIEVLSGHGSETTIGIERKDNPFL